MADAVGIKVAKWTKITDEGETRTVDILADTAGVERLAVSPCEKSVTDHFNGTVGTSFIAIPTVAGNEIQTVIVKAPKANGTETLSVSFDGGTTFFDLHKRDYIIWSFTDDRTQIHIKGSAAGVGYQIIMNREAS